MSLATNLDYGTCPTCCYLTLPVLPLSPCGHEASPVVAPLTEVGVVYAHTRVWSGEVATIQVMADFFDGRLRVNGPLREAQEVSVGDRVQVIAVDEGPYALRLLG